jgi:hypothetical protein
MQPEERGSEGTRFWITATSEEETRMSTEIGVECEQLQLLLIFLCRHCQVSRFWADFLFFSFAAISIKIVVLHFCGYSKLTPVIYSAALSARILLSLCLSSARVQIVICP